MFIWLKTSYIRDWGTFCSEGTGLETDYAPVVKKIQFAYYFCEMYGPRNQFAISNRPIKSIFGAQNYAVWHVGKWIFFYPTGYTTRQRTTQHYVVWNGDKRDLWSYRMYIILGNPGMTHYVTLHSSSDEWDMMNGTWWRSVI